MTRTTATAFFALALVAALTGCPGEPPRDALQAAADAISRAQEAEDCATTEYNSAVRLYEEAQRANEEGDYERARLLAESAAEQAERARLVAQANAEDCEERRRRAAGLDDDADGRGRDGDALGTFVDVDYELVPVYFGFDAFALDARSRQTLERHAEFLATNDLRIIIEGHCDRHGTEAYNLALGDSRARVAAQYLITLGVDPDRISTVSYGEFRPSSEYDDALNRRAEFKVRGAR